MILMKYLDKCSSYAMTRSFYPIRIIFSNILSIAIYPDMRKLANVTPIFKNEDNT